MKNPVKTLNQILKETFNDTVHGMIAKCPAWGHDCYCFIFDGPSAELAAALVANRFNGTIKKDVSQFEGNTMTFYTVSFSGK